MNNSYFFNDNLIKEFIIFNKINILFYFIFININY